MNPNKKPQTAEQIAREAERLKKIETLRMEREAEIRKREALLSHPKNKFAPQETKGVMTPSIVRAQKEGLPIPNPAHAAVKLTLAASNVADAKRKTVQLARNANEIQKERLAAERDLAKALVVQNAVRKEVRNIASASASAPRMPRVALPKPPVVKPIKLGQKRDREQKGEPSVQIKIDIDDNAIMPSYGPMRIEVKKIKGDLTAKYTPEARSAEEIAREKEEIMRTIKMQSAYENRKYYGGNRHRKDNRKHSSNSFDQICSDCGHIH